MADLNAAVKDSSVNDILMSDGVYKLDDGQYGLSIERALTIRAAPGATVVLDGGADPSGQSGGAVMIIDVDDGAVALQGLEITNGARPSRATAWLRG